MASSGQIGRLSAANVCSSRSDNSTGKVHELTRLDFVKHVTAKGRLGLLQEYAEIISSEADDSLFNQSKANHCKNRYIDRFCLESTRVVLASGSAESDYIHANFLDGHNHKRLFIAAQGPLNETIGDFWQMIWEQKVGVIAMMTRAVEGGWSKCCVYWPTDECGLVSHHGYRIENVHVERNKNYVLSRLRLINTKVGSEPRDVTHLQFVSWPEFGVPSSPKAVLDFLEVMRQEQTKSTSEMGVLCDGLTSGPPIVVHCSAGIGRTGTLCTIEICLKQLLDTGKVDVMGTVQRLRGQRAHIIEVPDQYLFCHAAILQYCLAHSLIMEENYKAVPNLFKQTDSKAESQLFRQF